MRRRALLASLGAATLSGCTGLVAEESPTTTDSTTVLETAARTTADATTEKTTDAETTDTEETGSEDGDSGPPPSASVVDLETGDLTLALAPAWYQSDDAQVSVEFAATATPDRPATLRAELTNVDDDENALRLAEIPPFCDENAFRLAKTLPFCDMNVAEPPDRTHCSSWYLVPTANHDLVGEDPDYRRGPEGYWRLADEVAPNLPSTVRLKPGETVAGEYVLLGGAESEGRPTGTYEFRGFDDPSMRITVWKTSAPGPEATSRFAGRPTPNPSGDGETRWYHDAGPETTVFLEPSTERARVPARVEFTLYNRSREDVVGNPYHWVLYKLHDGEWFHVAPWMWSAPMGSVRPGGTEDWTLYAFDGDAAEIDGGTAVGYLGGGRYAFEVGMSRHDATNAAAFELVGSAVSVEPEAGVEASREGATVTVDAPDPDHDYRPATLTLRRADAADERLIPEQVMQHRFRALRNGLPFFESGVERVVVETTRNAAQVVLHTRLETPSFLFDGRAYKVELEPDD